MVDRHSPQHDAALAGYWDAVNRGDRVPDPGTLDTGDIAFVRRMHELAHAPRPGRVREDAQRRTRHDQLNTQE